MTDPSDGHTEPLAAEFSTYLTHPGATADHSPTDSGAPYTATGLLGLNVQHYPLVGISVVVVEGALDLLTAPLLEQRVTEQLLARPTHLILDLESVRFLGSSGLGGLLRARELAQAGESQLHLAGLITRVVARAVEITGLLGLFSAYPTLLHAVIDLARQAQQAMPVPILPAPVRTAWWAAHGTSWTLELRWWGRDTGLGPLADSISCRVPVTQSVTDTMAAELLAARGLWLFADSSGGPLTGSRHRVGCVSDDAQLIALAHRVSDDATQAGVHPIMLAAWMMAGFSTQTATGWIRAGCRFPR